MEKKSSFLENFFNSFPLSEEHFAKISSNTVDFFSFDILKWELRLKNTSNEIPISVVSLSSIDILGAREKAVDFNDTPECVSYQYST